MARTSFPHLLPPDVEPDYDRLAQALADVGEEVAVAEDRIKRAAVEALDRGDVRGARELLVRWLDEPAVAVAAGLEGSR